MSMNKLPPLPKRRVLAARCGISKKRGWIGQFTHAPKSDAKYPEFEPHTRCVTLDSASPQVPQKSSG